jgi:hypothetical protein
MTDSAVTPEARLRAGDPAAAGELFAAFRGRLKRMVRHSMDPIDREVLGLTKTAASNRYIRALKRLKEILSSLPEM